MATRVSGVARTGGGSSTMSAADFRALWAKQTGVYGDGRHGAAELDGTSTVPWATVAGGVYTMNQDALCTFIIIRSTAKVRWASSTGVFRLKATQFIYIEELGWLCGDGVDGVASTAANPAYTAGTLGINGAGGGGGAAAGNGVAGTGTTVSLPTSNVHTGGTGGAGAATTGGAGGAATGISVTRGYIDGGVAGLEGLYFSQAGVAADQGGTGGGGGGGGAASVGGQGGSGGAPGLIAAPVIINLNPNGITSDGGAGGPGGGAGAGGGGGGGGGKIRYWGGLTGYEPHAYSGAGGAAGDATGFIGKTGLPGVVLKMGPAPLDAHHITLTTAECSALVNGSGDFDATVEFLPPSANGDTTVTPGLSPGGGSFWALRGVNGTGGKTGLRINADTNVVELVDDDVVVLSTATLVSSPAAPTMQNWRQGVSLVTIRGWITAAGGAASLGIAIDVDGAQGSRTVGVNAGGAVAAIVSGTAYGYSATGWSARHTRLSTVKTANVVGRVVVLGDSLSAPRTLRRGLAVRLAELGVDGTIVSLAQGGDTVLNQLTDWQASVHRGNAAVQVVVVSALGANDIVTGRTAAQLSTDRSALIADINAQNPGATVYMLTNIPGAGHYLPAQQAVWLADRDNCKGTGANPVTGTFTLVDTHVAKMGDANLALRIGRGDASDNLHEDDVGCGIMAAELVAAGLT